MIDVPAPARNMAAAVGAADWLAELPDLVADLADEWKLDVGAGYTDSTEAYVARVVRADGTPAVLKLLIPRHGGAAHNESTVLALADGEACPRLYECDEARSALLMEQLGPSLKDVGRPVGERHEILCDVGARLWRPAPDCGLRTGAEKGRWLIEQITTMWEELDRPCSERAVQHAVDCAERRIAAHDDERAVLVHGDVHQWNTLQAGDGWKLVDPDGLLADAEYDLGIIMREDPVELMDGDPHDRAEWLADRSGKDAAAIWEWGVVERVSTGLLGRRDGLQPTADQMLHAADVIAADDR